MSEGTLSHRLAAARSRAFVGRAAELELFWQGLDLEHGLDGDAAPFSLLWLHGPGGVGKSTLLQQFSDLARGQGVHVVQVDARTCDPSPAGVQRAVGDLSPRVRRVLLLIDTAELLARIEDWLREDFLPGLPEPTFVVIASRHPPGPRWRAELGWAEQMRTVALSDFDHAAATMFLTRRGVPTPRVPDVIDLTRGHPLALALVADLMAQRRDPGVVAEDQTSVDARPLTLAQLTGVLPDLLERFVDEVPDPLHRKALEVLGHARVTTEGLLRAVVGEADAADCFAWLRSLSFAQLWTAGPLSGLLPHDLARDVLDSELHQRDPDGWTALRRSIRQYYLDRMRTATGAEQARAVSDLLWFHRDSPALAAYGSWDAAFSLWVSPSRPADLPAILALVADHEGSQSVQLHEQWWRAQPSAFWTVRAQPGEVAGFVVQLTVDAETGPALLQQVDDPFVRAAFTYVATNAALRPGEHLRIVRSWIARDGYYHPTPAHQAITGLLTRTWVAEPRLAVSIAYSAHEPIWTPMFGHIDYARVAAAEVEFEGRPFAAYLHDWRVTPMLSWLELLESRDGTTGTAAVEQSLSFAQRHLTTRGAPALSQTEFAAAVRDAFRWANRADVLARNPLSRTRLTGPDGQRSLRDVLVEQVAGLERDPRRERLARVLTVTYLTPAATQEAAAARLSLPFSTYRRHLSTALAEVTRTLWEHQFDT